MDNLINLRKMSMSKSSKNSCRCCSSSFHETNECPVPRCIFNCGFCRSGVQHICRTCHKRSDHRTIDCPMTKSSSGSFDFLKYCSSSSKPLPLPSSRFVSIAKPLPTPISASSAKLSDNSIFRSKESSPFLFGESEKYNESDVSVTTTYVCYRKNDGTLDFLVCRRGVGDNNYGKIYTQGGGVDSKGGVRETVRESAIRELLEEAGLNARDIRKEDVYKSGVISADRMKSGKYIVHFYVILNKKIDFKGPTKNAWEIIDDTFFQENYGITDVRKGVCWLPSRHLTGENNFVTGSMRKLFREVCRIA